MKAHDQIPCSQIEMMLLTSRLKNLWVGGGKQATQTPSAISSKTQFQKTFTYTIG